MSLALPVTSAVSNVEHPHLTLSSSQRHQGGTHATQAVIPLRSREDGFIGGAEGTLRRIGKRNSIVWIAVGQQAKDFVHSNRTGNFTRSCPSHAVAYEINTRLDGEAVGVFV